VVDTGGLCPVTKFGMEGWFVAFGPEGLSEKVKAS